MPSNQNNMEKETVSVTENRIEENRKEMEKENQTFMGERVIKSDQENQNIVKESLEKIRIRGGEIQLTGSLETSYKRRVMSSHVNTSTLTDNNKQIKKTNWVGACSLMSIVFTSVIINIHGFASN